MKQKSIGKTILKVTGAVLALAILVLGISMINNRIRINRAGEEMKDRGLYNPVSVGDHSLNVNIVGNSEGKHRIVTLSGWEDGTVAVSWRKFTEPFEKDNELIFIDRAGYGMSDDTDVDEYTAARTIEEYRTALKNAGVEAPYVLLGHSIGGLYSTYWVSHCPDEIEAVMIMDGSYPVPNAPEFTSSDAMYMKMAPYIENIRCRSGYARAFGTGYEEFLTDLTDEDSELSKEMLIKTGCATNPVNELAAFSDYTLMDEVFGDIRTNDIPKIYICSSSAYETEDEMIESGFDPETDLWIPESMIEDIEQKTGYTDDDMTEIMLEYFRTEREESIKPYLEKMGNCKLECLAGDHVIYLDRTEEVQEILTSFLSGIDEGS